MPGVAEGAGYFNNSKTYLGGYDLMIPDARHISYFDVIIIFHQVS